jgi:hypothetical protein
LIKDLPTVKIFTFSRGELIKDELSRSLTNVFYVEFDLEEAKMAKNKKARSKTKLF